MNTLNPSWNQAASRRQAGSLADTVGWRLRALWAALERYGQRRAAPELSRLALRMAGTEPEVAAYLQSQARNWLGR